MKGPPKKLFKAPKTGEELVASLMLRAAGFLALMAVFLFAVFLNGSRNAALDSTQSFVLALCSLFSAALFVLSVVALAESVIALAVYKGLRHALRALLFAAFILLSSALFATARFVQTLSAGL